MHLNLPEPTPVQYDIAAYLQDPSYKRKIVEGFRGVGKSWITSAYVCWLLLRDPQVKILVVSASKGRADDFSTFTQQLIRELPILQHLQPTANQRQSKVAFDVAPAQASHAPSVKSAGITGQITGSRADVIIADDVEVPNNSMTEDLREKLLKAVTEFDAILTPKPTSRVVYLGTPQTESSLYNKLREKGYNCRIWTVEIPPKDTYTGALAPMIQDMIARGVTAGTPVDPKRFNAEDLAERRLSYGKAGYMLQFMLDTSLSDAEKYPLKLSDLIVTALTPERAPVSISYGASREQELRDLPNVGFTGDRWYSPLYVSSDWAEYQGGVMSIDPSGRGKDETSYAVVKALHSNLFCTAIGGLQGGYDELTLIKLLDIAKEQKVNKIIIESNFGDGMFTQLLKPLMQKIYPCSIEEVRHNTQKELRMVDTLEPVLNRHKLIFDMGAVKNDLRAFTDGTYNEDQMKYSLFYQLTHLTRERGALKHDDRLDALAMAVAFWMKSLGTDHEAALKRFREEEEDRLIQEYLDEIGEGNGPRNRPKWVTLR